ncbi:hypothetical protein, partial [Klebsiella quasipneumoniae]|uniref:hypothetical protein n=1 Tax=Klebsiella quasipneumoniae TaxID=1463165 RepID=UPI00272FA7E8
GLDAGAARGVPAWPACRNAASCALVCRLKSFAFEHAARIAALHLVMERAPLRTLRHIGRRVIVLVERAPLRANPTRKYDQA